MANYDNIRKLNEWCYHILPAVYDDSISYYEFLCKVVEKLNELIDNSEVQNEKIIELRNEFEALKDNIEEELPEIVEGVVGNNYWGKLTTKIM